MIFVKVLIPPCGVLGKYRFKIIIFVILISKKKCYTKSFMKSIYSGYRRPGGMADNPDLPREGIRIVTKLFTKTGKRISKILI
jgi:hypothetical protein